MVEVKSADTSKLVNKLCGPKEEQIAARLMGIDAPDHFVDYVIASMRTRPWEWSINKLEASHKSGLVVDCYTFATDSYSVEREEDQIVGRIQEPVHLSLSEDDGHKLYQALKFLFKIQILAGIDAQNLELSHGDK